MTRECYPRQYLHVYEDEIELQLNSELRYEVIIYNKKMQSIIYEHVVDLNYGECVCSNEYDEYIKSDFRYTISCSDTDYLRPNMPKLLYEYMLTRLEEHKKRLIAWELGK